MYDAAVSAFPLDGGMAGVAGAPPAREGEAGETSPVRFPPRPTRAPRSDLSSIEGDGSFPFTAVVGQAELKLALMLCAVSPSVGGVLAMGDRGSGKSTTIRALADVLPGQDGRAAPVVDLPLGATEDALVGGLDLEQALAHGRRVFQPGLFARADGGFLYVDEVNLLEDHLVDLLLDVAASGENLLERDGLSVRHPARFVLVGSGNPEEGELRPQLLDRFGLMVDVRTPSTLAERVEVLRRRDGFDRDPATFHARWAARQAALTDRLATARRRCAEIAASRKVMERAAGLCLQLGCDGVRGELTLLRAARACAALEGRRAVSLADLRRVAPLALRHRIGRPGAPPAEISARLQRAVDDALVA